MKINRIWCMPSKNTFEMKPLKELLINYIKTLKSDSIIVDPFANKGTIKELSKRNDVTYITNDLDPQYDTDYHLDALEFLKKLKDNSIDLIVWDPPYSPRQISECYKSLDKSVNFKTTQASYWSKQKEEIQRILKENGYCITCSWNSGGIGKKYGMEIEEILLIPHGGWHNDTIIVVDKKQKRT